MLLDLGALVYELHRHGRRAPELLQQKAAELTVVDDEVRELERTLAGLPPDAEPEYAAGDTTEEVDALEYDDYEDDEETAVAEHEEPRA